MDSVYSVTEVANDAYTHTVINTTGAHSLHSWTKEEAMFDSASSETSKSKYHKCISNVRKWNLEILLTEYVQRSIISEECNTNILTDLSYFNWKWRIFANRAWDDYCRTKKNNRQIDLSVDYSMPRFQDDCAKRALGITKIMEKCYRIVCKHGLLPRIMTPKKCKENMVPCYFCFVLPNESRKTKGDLESGFDECIENEADRPARNWCRIFYNKLRWI